MHNRFKNHVIKCFALAPLVVCLHSRVFALPQKKDDPRNVCQYLGGRSDKNFLGSGNVAIVIEPQKTRVLFVQQWKEKAVFDWAAGTVRSWCPDRIEMNETSPPLGATISLPPVSRTVFITRNDVVG